MEAHVAESPNLSKAKFILAELSPKKLAMALDILESLKRHSS